MTFGRLISITWYLIRRTARVLFGAAAFRLGLSRLGFFIWPSNDPKSMLEREKLGLELEAAVRAQKGK